MAIQFYCANCTKPIEVDDQHAGLAATCPFCGSVAQVPRTSTYRPGMPVASPVNADRATGEAVVHTPGPPHPEAPRAALGRQMGRWSLICTGLAVVLYVCCVIGQTVILFQQFPPPQQPTMKQIQEFNQLVVQKHPWLVATQLVGTLLVGLGLALGVATLVLRPRGNWQGMLSVSVSGLFLLCLCTGSLVVMSMGGGL